MNRDEMIEILIEDRMWEWVYASCHDGLRDVLLTGYKGFENYTNQELKDILENELGEERVKEILRMLENKKKDKKPDLLD